MLFFNGRHDQTIDAKNRTVIPAEYRSAYENNTAILFPRPNGCISVYTTQVFYNTLEKMNSAAASTKNQHEIQKVKNFASLGITINFDGAGRFTVPESLIKHGNLHTDLVVLGCFDVLEIWSKESYEESEYATVETVTMNDLPDGVK